MRHNRKSLDFQCSPRDCTPTHVPGHGSPRMMLTMARSMAAQHDLNVCGDYPWQHPGSTPPGSKGSKARQVKFEGAFAAASRRRLGPVRLASVRPKAQHRLKRSRAYKRCQGRLRTITVDELYQATGRQGFAERQSPHGRQVRPTIESNDRPPGIFHLGRRCTGSLGCGWSAPQTALSTWGRFCCAEAETWDARSTWRPATA